MEAGGGGGGGGGAVPEFDLSGLQGEIPDWLKWIIDNKDIILAVLGGLAAGLIAIKLGLGGIQALGIGIMVAGIILLIQDVIKFLENPTWEGFAKILTDISIILIGLALVIGGSVAPILLMVAAAIAGLAALIIGIKNYLEDPSWQNFAIILAGILAIVGAVMALAGPIPALITAIVLVIGAVALAVYKHWEQIKAFFKPATDWINNNIIQPLKTFFQGLWDGIKLGAEILWEALKTGWNILKEYLKPIVDAIVLYFKTAWENIKIVWDIVTGYFKNVWETIKKIFSVVKAVFTGDFKGAWEGIKGIVDLWKGYFEGVWGKIKQIFANVGNFFKGVFESAWNSIKNIFSAVGSFFSGIWNTIVGIFSGIGQRIGDAVSGAFRGAVNAVLGTIERVLNTPIRAINSLIGVINAVPGVNLGYISTFSLPRMKTGAIVNLPNKGTYVGGGLAGESGREGVIPLTDSQAMAQLGREIGKNVLINLNNITSLNGRVINRELKQVSADQSFAYNT